ncbi:MAG: Ribosomal small subunit methyltransferase [Campylobacterota bacterium]|nr:Ribosomal small subunit methyltransferase [Campylobacterota bacterium]
MDAVIKFLLSVDAGKPQLRLSGDDYKYVIKVRRHVVGDTIAFRNRTHLKEEYRYVLESTDGRYAVFVLEGQSNVPCESAKKLHIGWCTIDPKTVEKVLPMLTEMGVSKITFIQCHRSQRNFRFDYERFERIMESSIMQCGRTSFIEFGESASLGDFLSGHQNSVILDFGGEALSGDEEFDTVIIGCEGGFHESERSLFANHRVRHFSSPMILRSESAAVAVAARHL